LQKIREDLEKVRIETTGETSTSDKKRDYDIYDADNVSESEDTKENNK
jgi:hypothetical protein